MIQFDEHIFQKPPSRCVPESPNINEFKWLFQKLDASTKSLMKKTGFFVSHWKVVLFLRSPHFQTHPHINVWNVKVCLMLILHSLKLTYPLLKVLLKMIFLFPRYVSFLKGNPETMLVLPKHPSKLWFVFLANPMYRPGWFVVFSLPGGRWTPLAAAAARCHARMKHKQQKKTALSAWLRRGGFVIEQGLWVSFENWNFGSKI